MYLVAIVGSGPAGLSAACRAAQMGDSHILLEAQPHLCNTIFRYQKRKLVMAHPKALPLRAAARFDAGLREKVLGDWSEDLAKYAVNVHYQAEVSRIEKTPAGFRLSLLGRPDVVEAKNVVLAIGCQGNLRKLTDRKTRRPLPGSELPYVQYQLDDPDEYRQETIVVIGSGDAGIENAIGLAGQNIVHIVNSGTEFSKAKSGNVSAVQQAIDRGVLKCHYLSSPEQISALPAGHPSGRRMLLHLNSKDGQTEIPCDRIIARLGADPPQSLVKSFGVQFPSDDAAALPQLSTHYESNVPGLYIIGALAGYPLIKQSMNQGYEVIEFLTGRPVQPADEPALRIKLARFRPNIEVESTLDLLHRHSPILAALNRLQLRDFFLDSETVVKAGGDFIYRRGDAGDSLFVVITGEAVVQYDDADPGRIGAIPAGRCFGELELISGRPRAFTVKAGDNCRLVEIPRGTALKLIGSHAAIREYVDQQYLLRALATYLAPGASEAELLTLVSTAQLRQYSAKDVIFAAGSAADEIHLVRSGSVTLSSQIGGRDIITSYCAAGQYFGEVDVIAATRRRQGAKAAVKTETIAIRAEAFTRLLRSNPALNRRVREHFRAQLRERLEAERAPRGGAAVEFLVSQGLGEATDALLIDESLCVRCDQCEKACAATHGNVSRLNREAGASFDNLHVPTSCRHCEHPHCMKDCPPDAIHRSVNGEVYINSDCIGCGNCERNCPYGVIQMGVATQQQPSLWRWLVLGQGPAPGSDLHEYPEGTAKRAVKCDMCKDRGAAGPACVQACPTGAAIRVGPEQFFKVLSRGER